MSRAESKARTRATLLASARDVFVERGFNAATVEEIAARAGFTRGAFYANFADKNEAFWEVAEEEEALWFVGLETELATTDQDEEELRLVERWFERMLADRPLQQAWNELMAAPNDRDRARFADLMQANRERIARFVEFELTRRPTPIAATPDEMAAMFLAMGQGLSTQRLFDPEAIPFRLFADAFAYLWMGATTAAADPSLLRRS